MTGLLSFSNNFMSSSILFLVAYIALPSERFASWMSLIIKNKSIITILNKTWPDIEPSGITDKSI